jgi:mannitol-specific phosphotransferase system IIBC component
LSETGHSRERRLIRSIGFVYALDYMPAPLLVGYNQLRRKLERAKLNVMVELVPVNDLPADMDLLFVPTQLEPVVRGLRPSEHMVVLDSFLNHPAYAELIERLQDGMEWYALPLDAPPAPTEAIILRYRGNVRID